MQARRITTAAIAGLAVLALAGCSTGSAEPDQKILHYEGGDFSSKKFAGCIDPSNREVNGPGDKYYGYPTRQISYDATGGDGSESAPFIVVSLDNAEMRVPVTVTLTLNTDCEDLQKFHENLANKYQAWWGGSDVVDSNDDKTPDGWVKMLNFVVGKQVDTTLDRVSQKYKWRDLWNNPAVKTEIETEVEKQLPEMIKQQAGGDYFTINTVTVLKPDPANEKLKSAVEDEQAAVAKANSAKMQADAEKAAAEAQVAVAQARAKAMAAEKEAIGEDAWIRRYAIDKGMNPWPNPVVAGQAAK